MLPTGVIRLDGRGPEGIGPGMLELDPADFRSPLPVRHPHEYSGDGAAGLSVGVWDTTTMQEALGPYRGDGFILVLEGAFAMVDGKGSAVTAKAGSAFATALRPDGNRTAIRRRSP
jgi:hypothetical protein